jgi:hypothetical protein
MSDALRVLIEADHQRPGPTDAVRTSVFAALGISVGVGVLPAGAAVAAAQAAAHTGAATTQVAAQAGMTSASSAMGAAATAGRLALMVKAPLVGVGMGALMGAALMAYVVKGPVASRSAHSQKAIPAAVGRAAAPAAAAPGEQPPVAPTDEGALTRPSERASRGVRSSAAALPHRLAAPLGATAALNERLPPRVNDPAGASASTARREETAHAAGGVLAAEQALLDPARAALARGDGTGALQRLGLHQRRFPSGALSQEREAMAIHALVLTGDRDSARSRAASFRSQYPGSLLWPMIDATLRSPP